MDDYARQNGLQNLKAFAGKLHGSAQSAIFPSFP
jgi:hypothetical protein